MVLFCDSEREILKCDHWKERYIALLSCGLLIVLYKVALTFDSVYEFLKCDHLREISKAAKRYFSADLSFFIYQVALTFKSAYEIQKVILKRKLFTNTFFCY